MKQQRLETLVDNWINGNRNEARRQARCFTATTIAEYLCVERGWPIDSAFRVADHLRFGGDYQAACDATYNALNN